MDKKSVSELPYHQTHADYLSGPIAKTLRDMTYSLTSLARVLHRRRLGHEAMYLALMTVPKRENRRESGLPDHSASSSESLMPTESQSLSRTPATTPPFVGS